MNTKNLILPLFASLIISCTSNNYTMEDFAKVNKTDAHYHIYSAKNNSMEQAQKDNFKLLAINTFSDNCERVHEVQKQSAELLKKYPEGVTLEKYDEKYRETSRYIIIRDNQAQEFRQIRFKNFNGAEYSFNGKPITQQYFLSQVKVREGEKYNELVMQ